MFNETQIEQYAKDWIANKEPWNLWAYRYFGMTFWCRCLDHPDFHDPQLEFKRLL